MQQLLWQRNESKAIPFFTALHFCIPTAVGWFLEHELLTFDMFRTHTKKGECGSTGVEN
jgi:hypothetical protein